MFHDVIGCSGGCDKIRDGGGTERWICDECARSKMIRDMVERICDENDEALKRMGDD